MVKIDPPDNFVHAIRHFLCEERKKRNLSQFELAWKSGLSRQCVSFFESGRRTPTFFSLLALARGLDMPAMKFMSMLINKVEYYEHRNGLNMVADGKKPEWKA
ncbi:MAG: helix-turn-helix transcriptional regulator [Fibromonadaceae bacterium]|nr:helix-turn-helix transcriptional regulator [Fibromonadaceae bacterium]